MEQVLSKNEENQDSTETELSFVEVDGDQVMDNGSREMDTVASTETEVHEEMKRDEQDVSQSHTEESSSFDADEANSMGDAVLGGMDTGVSSDDDPTEEEELMEPTGNAALDIDTDVSNNENLRPRKS